MAAEPVRADAEWLSLREPADAAARSTELVELLRPILPKRHLVLHDLGSGTGSMPRWLAPQLPGPQHWVLYDRDAELLARAKDHPPPRTADGSVVTMDSRQDDITRLTTSQLGDADLITASALLDMMTAAELDRFVDVCASASCPVLITLTVIGQVDLQPPDPLDQAVLEAFNDHQRRDNGQGPLLGPHASAAAAAAFRRLGFNVLMRPSPWQLGQRDVPLTTEWFAGWLGAAMEQRPELKSAADLYSRRRHREIASRTCSVTVQHEDLLVIHKAA